MQARIRRWRVISIIEPKYSTSEVLIKTSKVGEKNKIIIERGAYAGEYFIARKAIEDCPIKPMKNKRGGVSMMYYVPLSQLQRL